MKKIMDQKTLVDPETGKEISVISFIPEARDKDFIKIFKLMSMKVLKDLKTGLNGATDTLWWIIDKIMELKPNEEPIIWVDPETVAKELNISVETVRKHIKKLKDFKYIKQLKSRQHIYKINPHFLYKGSLVQYFEKQHFETDEIKEKKSLEKKLKKKTGDTASYSSSPF